MLKKRYLSYSLALFCAIELLGGSGVEALAQPAAAGDSLALESVVSEVTQSHPTVEQAREALAVSETRINLAKTAYLPDVELTAGYNRIGPAAELTFPGFGTFNLYPVNNYSAAVSVRESLYDFGKTESRLALEKENKRLSEIALEQSRQRLAVSTINVFYSIAYLQEAEKIKEEELSTLNSHLEFVRKKIASGSGTQYEELSTQVRISNVESQRIELASSLSSQTAVLNTLRGKPAEARQPVRLELGVNLSANDQNGRLAFALENRYEIALSRERRDIAELNYQVVKSQDNPSLNLIASGGFKNGYPPDLDKIKANFVAGVNFTYPIFDAERTKNNALIAQSAVRTNEEDIELTRRNITNEVVESSNNLNAAERKVRQYELQLAQARRALELAQTSFQSGAITNLDLLDATTAVSESRLSLLKAEIDYAVSAYKLKAAMGEKLY